MEGFEASLAGALPVSSLAYAAETRESASLLHISSRCRGEDLDQSTASTGLWHRQLVPEDYHMQQSTLTQCTVVGASTGMPWAERDLNASAPGTSSIWNIPVMPLWLLVEHGTT